MAIFKPVNAVLTGGFAFFGRVGPFSDVRATFSAHAGQVHDSLTGGPWELKALSAKGLPRI
jgi:hypothetical protein